MECNETLSDAFFDKARERLRSRLAPKRYEHSESTSEAAVCLARAYGVDERKARIAGLLHDWDKEYDDEGIRARVQQLGIDVDREVYDSMPRLLHGQTAAVALRQDFCGLEDDVLDAIERHTSGEVCMTDLDMVVYIADAIEPRRPNKVTDDLWKAVGELCLEDLFLMAYKQVLSYLIEKGYRLHPDTVRIWNYYASRAQARREEEGYQ